MVYLRSWSVIVLKQIGWLYITLKTGSLSVFGRIAQSYMAQNHPNLLGTKICKIVPNDIKNISKIRAFNKAAK